MWLVWLLLIMEVLVGLSSLLELWEFELNMFPSSIVNAGRLFLKSSLASSRTSV